jgi:hypothetical protein
MLFGSKKNKRVETMEASIREDFIEEASEEYMEEEEEEDTMVAGEDHLPVLTMEK